MTALPQAVVVLCDRTVVLLSMPRLSFEPAVSVDRQREPCPAVGASCAQLKMPTGRLLHRSYAGPAARKGNELDNRWQGLGS